MLKQILILSLAIYANAFVPLNNLNHNKIFRNKPAITKLNARFQNDISRRNFIELAPLASYSILTIMSNPQKADASIAKKAVVFGASGYTGGDTVRALLEKGFNVVAVTRRKVNIVDREHADINTLVIDNIKDKNKVTSVIADVINSDSLKNIMKNAESVIYCAASRPKVKLTGTPGTKSYDEMKKNEEEGIIAEPSYDVEDIGLVNVAKEAINCGVKRLVVVSSICAKCQKGKEQMGEAIDRGVASCENCYKKQVGEERIKLLYENTQSDMTYTIVRPGMLSPGERRGVKEVEFNQGISKSGIISRIDLADVLVAAADTTNGAGKTFEVYYKDTAQPVDMYQSLKTCKELGKSVKECFFGEDYKDDKEPLSIDKMLKNPVKGVIFPSGNEVSGDDYKIMLKKLKVDVKEEYDINQLRSYDIM
uniref:NAD dependent epimerase/dehydratase family protein n=1 Tax=Virus NIOZ-UU159 TaxID=2763270 RepID=A0A7S9SUT4_9VIRU|nr:MAG: NAD dependent epimerase/dehydratase family protein [Virus NIOZ-UU159]